MKRSLAVLVLLLIPIAVVFRPAAAQKPDAGGALERLRARARGRVEIERSPDGRRIRSVRGDLTPPSAEAPRDIAARFLDENAPLFGRSPGVSDLALARSAASPAGRHLRFAQSWRGLPVFDSGADVHVAMDGRVVLAHNDYAPRIDLSIVPGITGEAAARMAARDSGAPLSLARPIETELGIHAALPAPRLAWRVTIVADAPQGAFETILDARTGEVLRRRSLVQDSHLDGRGRVFDPSPVNTLRDTSLRDGGDADAPEFSPAYRIVPLPDLSRAYFDAFGPIVLAGPYVRVNDLIERPYNYPTSSGTGDFLFGRDRLEFENVMVYFHVDRSQRYIQSLGFNEINNRPVRIDPHGLAGADNSHYVGFPIGSGWIAFGEGGVDDAEDADVIHHEYGHAIQDNLGSSRVDLQACKLEYSIVSPK